MNFSAELIFNNKKVTDLQHLLHHHGHDDGPSSSNYRCVHTHHKPGSTSPRKKSLEPTSWFQIWCLLTTLWISSSPPQTFIVFVGATTPPHMAPGSLKHGLGFRWFRL